MAYGLLPGTPSVVTPSPTQQSDPNYNVSQDAAAASAGYSWDPVLAKYVKHQYSPQEAAQRQGTYINTLLGQLGTDTGSLFGLRNAYNTNGVGAVPHVGDYAGAPSSLTPVNPANPSAANAAAFAAAKDKAGASAGASIRALRGLLANQGQLGGGPAAGAMRQAVETANQPVNDVIRQQQVQDQQTNNQFAQFNAQLQMAQRQQDATMRQAQEQAAIAQRGQDVALRGQDIQQQEAAAQRSQAILAGLLGSLNINASYEG